MEPVPDMVRPRVAVVHPGGRLLCRVLPICAHRRGDGLPRAG
jgi:hypothetical protein